MSYAQAMGLYGTDRPDTRFQSLITDISECMNSFFNSNFVILSKKFESHKEKFEIYKVRSKISKIWILNQLKEFHWANFPHFIGFQQTELKFLQNQKSIKGICFEGIAEDITNSDLSDFQNEAKIHRNLNSLLK